jgi:hypothetical protein
VYQLIVLTMASRMIEWKISNVFLALKAATKPVDFCIISKKGFRLSTETP